VQVRVTQLFLSVVLASVVLASVVLASVVLTSVLLRYATNGAAQAHEALIKPLMRALLQHLGCEPSLFDERLTATNVGLRLNYYPPVR
jgi:hypothetical protein